MSGSHPAPPTDDLRLGARRTALCGQFAKARRSAPTPTVHLGATPKPPLGSGSASADSTVGTGADGVAGATGAPAGGVVAGCVLWSPRWDYEALVGLGEQLDGRPLVLVEPVPGLGVRRLLQWLLNPWWRLRHGYTFNRDLPVDLRAAGFVLTDIDRFTAGRSGLRTYLHGRAIADRARPSANSP